MGVRLPVLRQSSRLSRALCVCAASLFSVSAASAQERAKTVLVEPPAPLLPQRVGTLAMGGTPATGSDAPADLGAAAPVLHEDGLAGWEDAHYGADGGSAVRAYRFGDTTGAFAAYTLLRKPGSAALPPGVAANGVVSGNRVVLQSGVSVVVADLSVSGAARDAAIRSIVQGLPKVGGRAGLPPLLPTYVPARTLVPSSLRYAVGPLGYAAERGVLPPEVISFVKAAEVVTAEYPGRNGVGTLTMLLYPTPQIAGENGRAIESYFNVDASHRAAAGAAVKLRREGPLVLLATGGFSPAQAQELVESVHLRLDVSLNKPVPPEFHIEVRKTASLLVSIAVFSGVAGLAAVLLGLFLGLGRASIRVWMGKPAATEPEFLRLGLSRDGGPRGAGTTP